MKNLILEMTRRIVKNILFSLMVFLVWMGEIHGNENQKELIKDFIGSTGFLESKLSPDGEHLAFKTYFEGKRVLIVLRIKDKKVIRLNIGYGEDVDYFSWIDAENIFYELWDREVYFAGQYVMNLSKRKTKKLFKERDIGEFYVTQIVKRLPDKKNEFLAMGKRGIYAKPDLYRINLDAIAPRLEIEAPKEATTFIFDPEGNVKFAKAFKRRVPVLWRWLGESGGWSEPLDFDNNLFAVDYFRENLVGYYRDPETVLDGLAMIDPETLELIGSPRYYSGYDMSEGSFIRSNIDGSILGLQFSHKKPVNFWFESYFQQLEALLNGVFQGSIIEYLGRDLDGQYFYFIMSSDVSPPVLYRLDVVDKTIQKVFGQYPTLSKYELQPTQPIQFESDGEVIHGYLTLPKGEGPHKLVVDIHGGPYVRDHWGFNPEDQLYAASGYGVLRINYRGSTGYGVRRGYGMPLMEVVEKSVDDVIAGARWVLENHEIDPNNLFVSGYSFGGYAAMAVGAKTPELWKGIIAGGGVYDWVAMYHEDRRDNSRYSLSFLDNLYMDFEGKEELYRLNSPINNVETIRSPVLLLHGGSDGRVPYSQARNLSRALKKAGKEVELEKLSWGLHGMQDLKNKTQYYQSVFQFLNELSTAIP